ncbi:MAG: sugar-binding domain-containing protein [Arachnia sp.]
MSARIDGERARELAVRAATLYYLQDRNKLDIAEELGISRFRVARLLDLAKEIGAVTVVVKENPSPEDALAARLRRTFTLHDCVVVTTEEGANALGRVATAAAGFITSRLTPQDVLGLSWGRTLAAMSSYLGELPPARLVQLTGTLGTDLSISPLEIMRRATNRSDGESFPIVAPLLADSEESANMFRRQPEVRRALDAFATLTMAALSVGSWNPTTSQARQYLTDEERAEYEALGVEGEIGGVFLTRAGDVIEGSAQRRMIGITADALRPVPQKIVVAEGTAKAGTVLGALRGGLANSLIVDAALAHELLHLAT